MTITDQIRQAATETTAPQDRARYLCRHLYADGRRCGSPALRRETFCYYHHINRPPAQNPRLRKQERNEFSLSDPEDRTGVQITLAEVLRRIASNQIDPRRAGLLLYGLQIVSNNLPKPRLDQNRPDPVEEVVDDEQLGLLALEKEVPPPALTMEQWRKEAEQKAIESETNQKVIRECELRLKKRDEEQQIAIAQLEHEVKCLRCLDIPVQREWAEWWLEKYRQEHAAKLVNSTHGLQPHDVESPAEPAPIVPSINASSTCKPSTANRRSRRRGAKREAKREAKNLRIRKLLASPVRTPQGTFTSQRKPPARARAGEQDAHQLSAGGRSQ